MPSLASMVYLVIITCFEFLINFRYLFYKYGFGISLSGTAGVWRMAAMEEAGGWHDRTTVEDMDLAVRAGLLGWKFVFLNDLTVLDFIPTY